ncbi:MAG: hypothetical protein HYX25_10530 [Candidatus Solibacter usitatus]|nr:hypothetical protein [Candidatus Solibacter usitatus]
MLVPAVVLAGIWPEDFGPLKRLSVARVTVTDAALWDEYGLQQAERAEYASGKEKLTATAYRFQDSTGAFAAFQWQRPAEAKESTLGKLAVESAGGNILLAQGNYLLFFNGRRPAPADLGALFQTIPKLENSPLPSLAAYLPKPGLVPNSERYILGPVSLEKFDHGISPSTAGFHKGAEAQLGTFRTPAGDLTLAIFSYPTPQIARDRLEDFQRISGAMAKRAGPFVAAILAPASADEAEKLLALVRYEPTVTMSEYVPTRRDNIGHLVVTAFELSGILLGFCLVAGLAFGGFRAFFQHKGPRGQDEAMISLHLGDR